jgi:GAF domain-containing protein
MTDSETVPIVPGLENLPAQAAALLSGHQDLVANAANLSSLLFYALENVNWVGFYFLKGGELVVGPFQGRPACVSIPVGKGVCGTVAETRKALRVANVHAFEGHIACDAESRSEIVLPLILNGELIGVLDLDSPEKNRFSKEDERILKIVVDVFIQSLV